jgi:aspartate 1-decarboxylase
MNRILCKSKIHRACVTQSDLHYVGSITIDRQLMDQADLLPYEKVQVVNINNGQRFETYVIEGEAGSGCICVNGAAARLVENGDLVIVISYAQYSELELKSFKPKVVHVNAKNEVIEVASSEEPLTSVLQMSPTPEVCPA